jgi:hypothetical protein
MARKTVDMPVGRMKLYKSYLFKDKDPVIDELRTIMQEREGGTGFRQYRAIELAGGPSVTCMANWFEGDTRRPQSASVEACGRAMGMRRQWVEDNRLLDQATKRRNAATGRPQGKKRNGQ